MHPISFFARLTAAIAWLQLSASFSIAVADEATALPMVRQQLMKKVVTAPASTIEARVIRVQFPPGYKTPQHTHDGPGPRYVLKGHLQVEDSGTRQLYGPGDVFWETGGPMTVENVGGSDAEMVIFEVAAAQ